MSREAARKGTPLAKGWRMASRNASIAFAAVVVGIGGYALLRPDSLPAATAAAPTSNLAPAGRDTGANQATGSSGIAGPLPMGDSTPLPPGHPPIGAGGAGAMGAMSGMAGGGMTGSAGMPQANDDPATLTWKVPATWKVLPNPSAMRLATYRVPRAPADSDDTDVSVTRAGGTADANIERWLTQFDARGKETRAESTVNGLKVTVVDVSGTYLGSGMTPGAAPGSHAGWSLLAAIVEGPGVPYFVKITGPAASVHAARPAFDALVASVTPS